MAFHSAHRKTLASAACLVLAASGCDFMGKLPDAELAAHANRSPSSIAQADSTVTGSGVYGTPGALIPASSAVVLRITNGLRDPRGATTANVGTGNFQTAFRQFGANLPQSTNPRTATGYDQVSLLAYAACTDVPSARFGVIDANSVDQNRAALIKAGTQFVDNYTGGLGSNSAYAVQVAKVFETLVAADEAEGDSTRFVFISVCMAASSFGAQMMGF